MPVLQEYYDLNLRGEFAEVGQMPWRGTDRLVNRNARRVVVNIESSGVEPTETCLHFSYGVHTRPDCDVNSRLSDATTEGMIPTKAR